MFSLITSNQSENIKNKQAKVILLKSCRVRFGKNYELCVLKQAIEPPDNCSYTYIKNCDGNVSSVWVKVEKHSAVKSLF